jgi:hypothetical protein
MTGNTPKPMTADTPKPNTENDGKITSTPDPSELTPEALDRVTGGALDSDPCAGGRRK